MDKEDDRKNVQDLETLWARMKYLGKTDYRIQWDGDTPHAYWNAVDLGSVESLNNCSMDQLADTLSRARKQA